MFLVKQTGHHFEQMGHHFDLSLSINGVWEYNLLSPLSVIFHLLTAACSVCWGFAHAVWSTHSGFKGFNSGGQL